MLAIHYFYGLWPTFKLLLIDRLIIAWLIFIDKNARGVNAIRALN